MLGLAQKSTQTVEELLASSGLCWRVLQQPGHLAPLVQLSGLDAEVVDLGRARWHSPTFIVTLLPLTDEQ